MKKYLVLDLATNKERTLILNKTQEVGQEYESYITDSKTNKIIKIKYKVIKEILQ